MFQRIGLLLICLMLGGCGISRPDRPDVLSSFGAGDHGRVLASTKVVPDPHAGWTSVFGPQITQRGPNSTVQYLVLTRFRGDKVVYQIQAHGLFPKRVYLGEVYSAGRKLDSRVLDRERTYCGHGCTTIETVAVNATRAEMETYAVEGLTFEVIGRRDSILVSIPASYFAALLEKHRLEYEAAGGRGHQPPGVRS